MVAYAALSLAFGEVFPFSRYSMYAKLRGRTEGAVLSVRADGAEVDVARLHEFVGIDAEKVDTAGYPCSQSWVVTEARRWITDHPGSSAASPEVDVEIGFRILHLDKFTLHERWVPLTRGRACWRTR